MKFKEQLQFLIYCLKKRNDTRFIRNVYKLGSEYSLVNLEKGEGQVCNKIIYHIQMEPTYSGFFADYNRLLSLLYFADYYGMSPVVEFSREYTYAESHPVNGTENPFEYYFEQPSDILPGEVGDYSVRILSRKENAALAGKWNESGGGYGMSEEYIRQLGRISGKFIHLNEIVRTKIIGDIDILLSHSKCIGVHVRGTDFKHNYNGHPVQVTAGEYLEAARKLLEEGRYDKVFLATDDIEAITLFKRHLGDKVCFYEDVTRSAGNETVMKSTAERENHHYMLGLEVLRDMHTLAACDALVAGLSQVSYAARIEKASKGKEYQDMIILNKGINAHKENCPQ